MPQGAATFLLVLTALAVGGLAYAESDEYIVEMDLWIEGEQRGTPILMTSPGLETSVEIGGPSGQKAWRIELLLDPPLATEGAPSGAIWLDIAVLERRDGRWELLADSLLGVPEGQSAEMTVVEAGQEPATRGDSLVHLTAQASLLRPGDAQD